MNDIEIIESLIQKLDLQQDSDTLYFGEYEGAPILVNFLGIEPLSLNFKIKGVHENRPRFKTPLELKVMEKAKQAKVDFYGGYAWLSFYNLSEATIDNSLQIFFDFVSELKEADYIHSDSTCASCKMVKPNIEIVCVDSEIARICGDCLVEKVAEKEIKEEALNQGNKFYLISILPLLLICISVWTGFWIVYDKIFEVLSVKSIVLPNILIAVVLMGIGYLISFPLGTALKKSGIFNIYSKVVVICLLLAFTVLFGEAIYFTYSIEGSSFFGVLANVVDYIKLYHGQMLFLKAMLILAIASGIWSYSERTEVKIKFS